MYSNVVTVASIPWASQQDQNHSQDKLPTSNGQRSGWKQTRCTVPSTRRRAWPFFSYSTVSRSKTSTSSFTVCRMKIRTCLFKQCLRLTSLPFFLVNGICTIAMILRTSQASPSITASVSTVRSSFCFMVFSTYGSGYASSDKLFAKEKAAKVSWFSPAFSGLSCGISTILRTDALTFK